MLPQLSLGTAALVIFLLCAGFVMLRGATRMLLGTLVLGLATWAGFAVWKITPELSHQWLGQSLPLLEYGLPAAAFIAAFLAARFLINAIVRPFGGVKRDSARSGRLLPRLLLALVPTALIFLIAATLVYHAGTIAELRSTSSDPTKQDASASTLLDLKSAIQSIIPASWLAALDPLSDPSRVALAKLITAETKPPRAILIDPATGEPIPRAIIVEDPELQTLAREGKFGTLLRHPLLTRSLNDPKIQNALKSLQP